MAYKLNWKTEAKKDFSKLDKSIQKLTISQFKKLEKFPQLGLPLGNKAGIDLTGYKKLYFFKKKYRIVYKFDNTSKVVIIYSIGKRENMEVYKQVIRNL